jgi:hypothetical protein
MRDLTLQARTWRRTLTLCAASAGFFTAPVAGAHLAPPAASAPANPSATVSGVTVTAPERPDPLVDKTTQFVRQRLPTSRFEQYARFRDPICVKVIGLPAEFDAFVAKRVTDIARQVDAPVAAAANCTPNVNVLFSAQPQAQLDDISKRRDILFGFHWVAQTKQLSTFNRPVQSWYLTRTVGTGGDSALELNQGSTFTDGLVSLDARPVGRAGSRLGEDMSSELVHSLIIADANKVAGEKIDAVADYVAVLALSRWQKLETCSGLPTILNLMADGCDASDRPEAATEADLALLKGLYAADPRESGNQQRATIASAIRKANAPDKDHR